MRLKVYESNFLSGMFRSKGLELENLCRSMTACCERMEIIMKRSIAPLVFGLLLILAGVGYMGVVVFDWDFTVFFDGWWTLFIIVPALVSIFANGPKPFNIAAFLLGGLLLLRAQGFIPARHFGTIIISGAILYCGIALVIKFFRGSTAKQAGNAYYYQSNDNTANSASGTENQTYAGAANENNYNKKYSSCYDCTDNACYNAILSGIDIRNTSADFQGAKISAILGGADIDLRDAIVKRDVVVYATAVMGGIDILAPRNVRIMLVKTDILGGTECKAISMPPDSNAPIVTFNCTTIMAGIDIK